MAVLAPASDIDESSVIDTAPVLLNVSVPKLVVSPPLSPRVIDVPLKAALPLTEMVAPLASVIAPPALIVAVPLVTLRPSRFKASVSSICTFPAPLLETVASTTVVSRSMPMVAVADSVVATTSSPSSWC